MPPGLTLKNITWCSFMFMCCVWNSGQTATYTFYNISRLVL